MKYRKLGAGDLSVSEISLGSWLTYAVGVERDAAKACLERQKEPSRTGFRARTRPRAIIFSNWFEIARICWMSS